MWTRLLCLIEFTKLQYNFLVIVKYCVSGWNHGTARAKLEVQTIIIILHVLRCAQRLFTMHKCAQAIFYQSLFSLRFLAMALLS